MTLNNFGDTISIALLGLSGRGMSQMSALLDMPDVRITAVSDLYRDRIENAVQKVKEASGYTPFSSVESLECISRQDVDAVVITSDWETHIPLAIAAMKAGKRPAMEVGGSTSTDECWELVHTSESTGIPVMLLENCCFGEKELALLNMVQFGLFGTLVHCAGAYSHDLRSEIGNGDINRHYRQRHFLHRNAELYPTHELGPIANYLSLNRGNRMVSLTCMASKACGLHEWLVKNRSDTSLASVQVNEGDIVTTMIKCANGETILLTHDCTLPRWYSRGGVIRGTKGLWCEDSGKLYIEGLSPTDDSYWDHRPENEKAYLEKYMHPLWRDYHQFGVRGNHDGMDYLVLRAFVESVQNQANPPIDVYDAASWMVITSLSEDSIATGSQPVPIPDFTSGGWCKPSNSLLRKGIFENI